MCTPGICCFIDYDNDCKTRRESLKLGRQAMDPKKNLVLMPPISDPKEAT